MHAAYSGRHLCTEHFCRSVDSRVRRRIREDALLSDDATPEEPETWLVGLSGGKDSVVLTHVLHETFAADPRVELVAVTIHEGIQGYRDASLEACLELTEDLGLDHEVVSYAEEFGVEMDDVAAEDPLGMAPCAYCGVFRRDVLARYAADYGADKLLTGHNLDDEAQTAMMNLLSGDVAQVAKHFDASLGSFEDREIDDDPFVPRAKPLRDIPEKEVALYAHLKGLPAHVAECPPASEAYRGEIQRRLYDLEEDHPGTRHSIMSGYEELAALAAREYRRGDGPDDDGAGGDGEGNVRDGDGREAADGDGDGHRGECDRCGAPTTNEYCRACELLEAVGATHPNDERSGGERPTSEEPTDQRPTTEEPTDD